MRNRIRVILLYLIMVLVMFAGCSLDENEEDIVNNFLFYYEKGDYDLAIKYCSDDGKEHEKLLPLTSGREAELFMEYQFFYDYYQNNSYLQKLVKTYKENMISGYEIIEISVDEKKADVMLNVLEEENPFLYLADLDAMCVKTYISNKEYYDTLMLEQGEEAIIIEILDKIMIDFCQQSKDNLLKYATYQEIMYEIELCEQEGKIKILDMHKKEE